MQRKKILCSFITVLAMAFIFSTIPVMAKSTSDTSTQSSSKKSSSSKAKKTKKKNKSKSKTKKKSKIKKSSKSKKGRSDKSSSPKKKTKSANKKKTGKVNINSADAKTLTEFTGIGPVTAKKIVAYRKKNGKFKNAKDLMNVKGIGEKTLQKMKPQLKF